MFFYPSKLHLRNSQCVEEERLVLALFLKPGSAEFTVSLLNLFSGVIIYRMCGQKKKPLRTVLKKEARKAE